MSEPAEGVGGRVRALRRRAGLTQQRLARAAGLSVSAVCAIEQGRTRPQVETLRAIAAALGVTAGELAGADAGGVNS